jgi:hypothetical protein
VKGSLLRPRRDSYHPLLFKIMAVINPTKRAENIDTVVEHEITPEQMKASSKWLKIVKVNDNWNLFSRRDNVEVIS